MVSLVSVCGRKLFSLVLTFNCLLCIVYAIGLLAGFYEANWKLYPPYLVDGSLFWVIILASIVNIFPAMSVGRMKTGRLWFHHYVYGFVVLVLSAIMLKMSTSVPLVSLFTARNASLATNVGRFFVLGGLTLILDDLSDISKRLRSVLSVLKSKAYQARKIIHATQCLTGLLSFYIFVCVSLYIAQNPASATLGNLILAGTLLVTSLTSFGGLKRKIWLNITPEKV
ncbi:MAG: hypothetical protein ABSF24_09970 [Candidatus Bathyarchaeia archaeon]